jgi:superfamily II DNA or RNA helicase
MGDKTLFPFQQQCIDNTRLFLVTRREQAGLWHVFTGGGKSLITIECVKQVFPVAQNRILFTAPTRELVSQMLKNFYNEWPECRLPIQVGKVTRPGIGMVMEKHDQNDARIIVASTPTLTGDILSQTGWELMPKDLQNQFSEMTPDEQKEALLPYTEQRWQLDNAQITADDLEFDGGSIRKSKRSLRTVLVSERADRILANGGLPSVIFNDEAHYSMADGTFLLMLRFKQVAQALGLPVPKLVGMTATPIRQDERGLHNLYPRLIFSKPMTEAQEEGYATPFATPIAVQAKHASAGIIASSRLTEWTDFVIDTWKEKAADRITIFYAGAIDELELSGIEASKELAAAFNKAGIPAVHLDGMSCIGTSGEVEKKERRAHWFKEVLEGRVQVICNFAVMITGVDLPPVSCVAFLRSMNEVQMTQAIGRCTRRWFGNEFVPPKETSLIMNYASGDINLTLIGDITGNLYDPTQRDFLPPPKPEDEEDEDELGQGEVASGMVLGSVEALYQDAKILSKSTGAWYRDPANLCASMSVNSSKTYVIVYPDLRKLMDVQYLLDEAILWQTERQTNVSQIRTLPAAHLEALVQTLQWCRTFYGNFSLWELDVYKDPLTYTLQASIVPGAGGGLWKELNPMLSGIETMAISDAYAYLAALPDDEKSDILMSKRKSWRSDPVSEKQMNALNKVRGGKKGPMPKNKGEAAKMIDHEVALKVVLDKRARIDAILTPFAEYAA